MDSMTEDQPPAPFNGGGQAEEMRDGVGTLVALTPVHGGETINSRNHTWLSYNSSQLVSVIVFVKAPFGARPGH